MLLARDEKSRLLQIRSLVSLLRSKELACDYGKLASDLRALMNPKRRPGVLLRWGDIDLLAPSRLRRKYRTV